MYRSESNGDRLGHEIVGNTPTYLEIFGGDEQLVARFEGLVNDNNTLGIKSFFLEWVGNDTNKTIQHKNHDDFLAALKILSRKLGYEQGIPQTVKAYVSRVKRNVESLMRSSSMEVSGNPENLSRALEKARLA